MQQTLPMGMQPSVQAVMPTSQPLWRTARPTMGLGDDKTSGERITMAPSSPRAATSLTSMLGGLGGVVWRNWKVNERREGRSRDGRLEDSGVRKGEFKMASHNNNDRQRDGHDRVDVGDSSAFYPSPPAAHRVQTRPNRLPLPSPFCAKKLICSSRKPAAQPRGVDRRWTATQRAHRESSRPAQADSGGGALSHSAGRIRTGGAGAGEDRGPHREPCGQAAMGLLTTQPA